MSIEARLRKLEQVVGTRSGPPLVVRVVGCKGEPEMLLYRSGSIEVWSVPLGSSHTPPKADIP